MSKIDFYSDELENRKNTFSRIKYLLLVFIFLASLPLLIHIIFLNTKGYYVAFTILELFTTV
jgi:uncharacterized membrane protein YiaA